MPHTREAERDAENAPFAIRSKLQPMPPEYMDRDARVARVEDQGLEGAWLLPTAGVLYEQAMSHGIEALRVLIEGFNRWLEEDWGLARKGKLFCALYVILADVEGAAPRRRGAARSAALQAWRR